MKSIEQPKTPLWKKSMLERLNFSEVVESLYEIMQNGNAEGYDDEQYDGYYNEYREEFNLLSEGAELLFDSLNEQELKDYSLKDYWDDITVGLLGVKYTVLGFDSTSLDYYSMLNDEEDLAVEKAKKRLMRMTKQELIDNFSNVLRTLLLFFDLKASHDCLVSIVQELDERAAAMKSGNTSNRMWVE